MTEGLSERQRALLAAMGIEWPAVHRPAMPEVQAPDVHTIAPAEAPPPQEAPAVGHWGSLEAVADAVRDCKACGLCEGRRNAVPGGGHARAHWMVVGEAPGEQEDLQGEAFVGRSGELLNDILAALQLTRGAAAPERQVFIANAVKCRPPENRTPRPEEVSACAPFLDRQLALVQPRLVVALGKVAAQRLLQTEAPVGSLRGKVHRRQDGLHVVVSYHPSYLLRQPLEKARAWEDWCLAAEWMNR